MTGPGHWRFGEFELDAVSGKLLRDGAPVKIQPQPLRVLCALVEHAGQTVSRDQLRSYIWDEATFVEFDEGLNYCIRQIRMALGDKASHPVYIETLPKQGYRFIAALELANGMTGRSAVIPAAFAETSSERTVSTIPAPSSAPEVALPVPMERKPLTWVVAICLCVLLAVGGIVLNHFLPSAPREPKFTQLTDFTDSAVAPALSPDGHTLAFIRGDNGFLTADQIYAKVLPSGETRRITDDPRLKYAIAFSPDGALIAYTVLNAPNFDTYVVSVLGGKSRLLLKNAAGLTWLDQHQLLFTEIHTGIHLGVVTGTLTRDHFRELYFPSHERGMAHFAYASPDRKAALVVEMDPQGFWGPCRLISMGEMAQSKQVGPAGSCESAAWSPDGSWMYFTAVIREDSHIWRQRFPDGAPEQITFGPTSEEGVVVEQGGRSVISSVGSQQNYLSIHDEHGERSLSSEGEILANPGSSPSFSADGQILYYLLRHPTAGSGAELWRMVISSGESDALLPGVSMLAYDISPDGKLVVFSQKPPGAKSELWLAPMDRALPPRRIAHEGEIYPHFGPAGQIVFMYSEGKFDYLGRMKQDGSARSKVAPFPISEIQSVSPDRHWVIALVPSTKVSGAIVVAIPVAGGTPRNIYHGYCVPSWSPNSKYLFVPVEDATRTSLGRSLAIPLGPDEALPDFPSEGLEPLADPSLIPGSLSILRARLIPGIDLSHFAYINNIGHQNLYRISLPR